MIQFYIFILSLTIVLDVNSMLMKRYLSITKYHYHQKNFRIFGTMSSNDSPNSRFFNLPLFAVVGASNDREKFGNKVLRCYLQNSKQVFPINKKSVSIEGIDCVESLSKFVDIVNVKYNNIPISNIGVSIITPPGVTKVIIDEGLQLGYRYFFLQPGTVDKSLNSYIENDLKIKYNDAIIIQGCVLVDLRFVAEKGEDW